jgi:hypothetical protein|nr:MAG TPA: hypothetical protein [Caudoviricetes sp.]
MAPTDDNSVPGINVAGKNGAAFPVMGNAATGAILVASAGRGTGAISNAPKDANHVSGLVAKDKATGKAFAVQGNKDTGAIFVQDLNGGGGGGAATWGSITGDISDNAELTAELNKKADKVINAFSGTGQPNGKVSAPPGSEYTDTAVTCGAVKWIKMRGMSNTGWTVLYGDTGWRDISTLLINGWKNKANHMIMRRINCKVILRFPFVGLDGSAATKSVFLTLPDGFKYRNGSNYGAIGTIVVGNGFELGTTANLQIVSKDFDSLSTKPSSLDMTGELLWTTDDAYPSILPGTAA